jgi:hypothetical protein
MKGTGGRKCKFEQIREHLEALLEKHPDYKICTQGHSSGGALATLFAFFLAADDRIPKPIAVISIASPRVGNIRFSHAFQELEIHGRLQHLRVANRKDVVRWKSLTRIGTIGQSQHATDPLFHVSFYQVTQSPDRLTLLTFFFTDMHYRHVGIELTLYRSNSSKTCRITVPKDRPSRSALLLHDLMHALKVSPSCPVFPPYHNLHYAHPLACIMMLYSVSAPLSL